MDVTIAGVTDKVPTCYKGYGSTTLLFMNQKGFESLWADGKSGNELKPGMRHIRHMWLQKMQMNIRIH